MNITIFIHIYYEDTLISIYKKVAHLTKINLKTLILINLPFDHPLLAKVDKIIREKLPQSILIKTSNVGKDIGGKLALMELYLKLGLESDFILFIHDKKSPQTVIGEKWSEQLFKILDKGNVNSILKIFENEKIGMVGNKEMIFNKNNKSKKELFAGNEKFIQTLATEYGLHSKNFEFIGGTMFWVREKVFRTFFEKNNPLKIRSSLEKGNVLDDLGPTTTHSWERLFGWIITTQGYKIKGV